MYRTEEIMEPTGLRQHRKRQRRERILNAARPLFFSKGFSDTSIDEIARAAELAHGTIYLYFKNKEEIYATVLAEGLDLLNEAVIRPAGEQRSPIASLLAGYDAFVQFSAEHPEYYNALILDKLEIDQCLPAAMKAKLNAIISVMARWVAGNVDKGIEQGLFRPMEACQTAFLLMGMATGFVQIMDTLQHSDMPPGGLAGACQAPSAAHDLIASSLRRVTDLSATAGSTIT